jgi:hypothetical protein
VSYEHVTVDVHGPLRSYAMPGNALWRLHWRRTGAAAARCSPGDTVLSEVALSEPDRSAFRAAGVHWLDLAGRTRSIGGSPLTEELASFLGRYGIRLPRDG